MNYNATSFMLPLKITQHTINVNMNQCNKRGLTHCLHGIVERSTNKSTTYPRASLVEFISLLDAKPENMFLFSISVTLIIKSSVLGEL